jgi:uncharacterized membrane protein YqjE
MHTRASESHTNGHGAGLGGVAKLLTERLAAIVRLELKLAAAELSEKVKALGVGAGMLAGAALLGVVGLLFLLATVTAVLAIFLPEWLALLLMTVVVLAGAAGLGLAGLKSVKKGSPPVPTQAIHEAKLTREAVSR